VGDVSERVNEGLAAVCSVAWRVDSGLDEFKLNLFSLGKDEFTFVKNWRLLLLLERRIIFR